MRLRPAALVLAAAILGATGAAAAGAPGGAPREPRVTLIGDSVSAALDYAPAAARYLGRGLDLKLDAKVCRRLVAPSCSYMGTTPSTALSLIQMRGSSLGGTVVMDVGYNEDASGYSHDLDTIMSALVKAKVRRVIWVTLREERPTYSEINAVIRAAPARWSRLSVADWNAASSGEPWFSGDGLHLSGAGALGLADFLRPDVLDAVRAGRSAARPSSPPG